MKLSVRRSMPLVALAMLLFGVVCYGNECYTAFFSVCGGWSNTDTTYYECNVTTTARCSSAPHNGCFFVQMQSRSCESYWEYCCYDDWGHKIPGTCTNHVTYRYWFESRQVKTFIGICNCTGGGDFGCY
jgi:hypothetical protein